ncbi:MAG: 4Fe-4S dicluster domain-containing protein [Clostridiales bacterium]|nr:4Fe-4S dicluster domain-containing protein [Clostridiales bacterium]
MAEKNLSSLSAANAVRIEALADSIGAKLHECYQCGKCTAGCPMAGSMDLMPRQVIRHLQLGLLDEALHSRAPWICATCYTCSARCPHDVPISELMEAVRQQAERAGIRPIRRSHLFTKYFLLPLKWFGKNHELTLTMFYNLASGRVLQHFSYLPAMLKGSKLKIFPARVKNREAVRRLMENCEREAERI